MPHCQELKNQLAETSFQDDLSEMKGLLAEYKETGSAEVIGKLVEKKIGKEEKLKKVKKILRVAIDNLVSQYSHLYRLQDKLVVRRGKVVCEGSLRFRHKEEVYLPSVIEEVEGVVDLFSLESAKQLNLPSKVGKSLILKSLESAKNLNLPREIGFTLHLDSLKSAKHLELPDKVGGFINLTSLKSTNYLDLSNVEIRREIYLGSLSDQQIARVKEEYPHLTDKITNNRTP